VNQGACFPGGLLERVPRSVGCCLIRASAELSALAAKVCSRPSLFGSPGSLERVGMIRTRPTPLRRTGGAGPSGVPLFVHGGARPNGLSGLRF